MEVQKVTEVQKMFRGEFQTDYPTSCTIARTTDMLGRVGTVQNI